MLTAICWIAYDFKMLCGVKIDRILEFYYKLVPVGIVCHISRIICLNKRYFMFLMLRCIYFHFNWCIKTLKHEQYYNEFCCWIFSLSCTKLRENKLEIQATSKSRLKCNMHIQHLLYTIKSSYIYSFLINDRNCLSQWLKASKVFCYFSLFQHHSYLWCLVIRSQLNKSL